MKKSIAIIENNVISTLTVRSKLAKVLMEQGYRVTVLTTGTNQQLNKAKEMGFEVIDIKSSNQHPLHILQYLNNLRKALKQSEADICLTFTIRPAIWGNFVTRLMGIPTITNITGVGPLFASRNLAYRIARMLYKSSLKKTKKIFFQNTDDRKLFLDHGFVSAEMSSLIPGSGVDHEFFKPIPKTQNQQPFVFLYIGRLLKDKGIVEFVEAARIIKKNMPEVEFRVIGPLWLQNLKENTITKEQVDGWVEDKIIHYVGELSDVRPEIAQSDCLVLPSYREGTSNVLLEASSMERPCITCDTTGCREIVADGVTGYLCKVADTEDLADKMQRMLSLSVHDREQMGKMARNKVVKEFDKKIVIDAYLQNISTIFSK